MGDTLPQIRVILEASGHAFEVWDCDPDLADTARFCEHYGVSPGHSANTILVRTKTGERRFAACVLLATHRLDVNHTVRKRLGARRVSFAGPEETSELTGMPPGGVTPFALPGELPVWIDPDVLVPEYVILGGGNRVSKLKVDPRILLSLPGVETVPGLAMCAE